MTHKEEKATQIFNLVISTVDSVKNGIPQYLKALPPKRKNIFLKVWYWRKDRKQRRFASIHLRLPVAMSAAQIATIVATPIPKYKKGSDNHEGGEIK